MSRSVVFAPGELYHLYNRGTDKRRIYMSAADHERFLALMFFCNDQGTVRLEDVMPHSGSLLHVIAKYEREETLVDICTYCLMPNHFHMLVREKHEGGISKFMQKLATGYTMYFNTRHERNGSLFQGKFKAQHAPNDKYLKYLVSYIHLNPVKLIEPTWKETGIRDRAKAEQHLRSYRYSSYMDYSGIPRAERHLINTESLKEYYDDGTPLTFSSSVREWLEYAEESRRDTLSNRTNP